MPIYIGNTKYIGGYRNGQKFNGYFNNAKIFSYAPPFDKNNPYTWPGKLYSVSGTCDPFPAIDGAFDGGAANYYDSPFDSSQQTGTGGMMDDTSSMNISAYYIAPDGTKWCYGTTSNNNNNSGTQLPSPTWTNSASNIHLSDQQPLNYAAGNDNADQNLSYPTGSPYDGDSENSGNSSNTGGGSYTPPTPETWNCFVTYYDTNGNLVNGEYAGGGTTVSGSPYSTQFIPIPSGYSNVSPGSVTLDQEDQNLNVTVS